MRERNDGEWIILKNHLNRDARYRRGSDARSATKSTISKNSEQSFSGSRSYTNLSNAWQVKIVFQRISRSYDPTFQGVGALKNVELSRDLESSQYLTPKKCFSSNSSRSSSISNFSSVSTHQVKLFLLFFKMQSSLRIQDCEDQ